MRITWERRRLDAIIQIFVYAGLPAAPVCGNRSLWNQINYLCQFPQEPAKHTAHHKFVQKIGCPLWPRRSTVFSVCVCNCERVCVVERGFSWHLWFLTAHAQVCVFLFPHTHRCSEDSWVSTRQAIVSASSQIIRELCCVFDRCTGCDPTGTCYLPAKYCFFFYFSFFFVDSAQINV